MSLINILILVGFSLAIFIFSKFNHTLKLRNPLLLVLSTGVIFWLQPALPIRGLDFWLPIATLALVALGWVLTSKPEERNPRASLITGALVIGAVLVIALTRYLGMTGIITPSRPPQTLSVIIMLTAVAMVLFLSYILLKGKSSLPYIVGVTILLVIFAALKLPVLTEWVSGLLRLWSGQSRELASALDLRWLGFSYIAFRLIHTLRDRQNGRLPAMALDEYFIYMLFFPAISAGPIDRSERFIKDLRQPFIPSAEVLGAASKRLVIGLLKKFVIADLLAMIALNAVNAGQINSTGWAWVLVYAYAFQIFFDFSGYTDIAISMGLLIGIKLPENFNAPYLKPNLTQFWNNWHMTLTQWFRAYFFNPFTRALRSSKNPVPVWAVILITQLATMTLIGLWHGITINFVLWGLWHGLGIFIQNRWSDWTKPLSARIQEKPFLNKVVTLFTILLTFQFVALGWVWFALPSTDLSLQVFGRLFGMGA
ncbi:MAG: MBOAT family O-acyltransferase [Anaerolineaceae bacterium]|nr:MBOAT family O-acyltransferase [Anaerolineaceae bacterium]